MDDLTVTNLERANKMVALIDDERRAPIERMLEGPVGQQFFSAPASTKLAYHCAFAGGLLDHSIRVAANLRKVCDTFAKGKHPIGQIVLVGLLHDLGKAGDGVHPMYLPLPPDDWRFKRGEPYEYNKDCTFMPHSDMSLFLLQQHGVKLSAEEFIAIRIHDGLYEGETNRRYAMKEPELALFLHWADMQATREEKELYAQ
jgi:hypothetical protein